MSAVTFTAGKSRHYADVRGSERAYARHVVYAQAIKLITDLATSTPERSAALRERLYHLDSYVADAWKSYDRSDPGSGLTLERVLTLWFNGDPSLKVHGESIGFGELGLNTALVAGSAPIRLLAYLHGSCEDHGYFEPPHDDLIRAIMTGRRHGVLRADAGWEGLVELAQRQSKAMLIMSYSVCENYHGTLKALREAWWPVDFARHLYTEEPQGYLNGRSAFDLLAEVNG